MDHFSFCSNQITAKDTIDSYFECISECSIFDGHQECITRCVEVHLKGGNNIEWKIFSLTKTTLTLNSNGDLSEINMLRILDKISAAELIHCELTCDIDIDI